MTDSYFPLHPVVNYYSHPRPIDWREQFGNQNPLDLEIGFGTGEYIVRLARENQCRNFVGIEEDDERIHKTLRKIAQAHVENVRLVRIDAQVGLERLMGPQTLEKVYCLFPCPWPKRKDQWHRLFSTEFLKLTNSRLKPAGHIKIVTDHRPYMDWLVEQTLGTGFIVQEKQIGAQFGTKFERKWAQQGQSEFYEVLLTKTSHQKIGTKKDALLKKYYFKEFDPRTFSFENETGETSIVLKELLYDETKKKAMLRLFISEEPLTQNIWMEVFWHNKKWCLQIAPGCLVLPTQTVATALEKVYQRVSCHA